MLFVGDSLTEGASELGGLKQLVQSSGRWESVVFDYKRGRRITDAVPVVRARLARAKNTGAVVIALGTNDMLSRGETWYPAWVITTMMSELGNRPVLWVNVAFDGLVRPIQKTRAVKFNRALRTATAMWPNLTVADWSGYFKPSGRSRYIVDGVHLTTSGYRTRAAWTRDRINSFATSIWNQTSTTTTTSSTTTSSTTSIPLAPTSTTTSTITTGPAVTTTGPAVTTTTTTLPSGS